MEAAHHLPLSPLSVTFPTFLIPSFSFLKKMAAFVYYLFFAYSFIHSSNPFSLKHLFLSPSLLQAPCVLVLLVCFLSLFLGKQAR